jgi:MFS family permease
MGCLFSVITGFLVDRYGVKIIFISMGVLIFLGLALSSQVLSYWQLLLTYGVLVSLGTGPAYPLANSVTTKWFQNNRAMALAIVTSGVGLGSFVIVPIISLLIAKLDWRTAYLITGLFAFLIIASFSLFLKSRQDTHIKQTKFVLKHEADVKSIHSGTLIIIKSPKFIWLFLMWMFYSFCLFTFTTHIVAYSISLNINPINAALIISIYGLANIPSRLISGWLCTKYSKRLIASLSSFGIVVSLVMIVYFSSLGMLLLISGIFGFSCGFGSPPMTSWIGDTFETKHAGKIFGMLDIASVIGAASGPAIAGYIFDLTVSYNFAWWICVASAVMLAILIITYYKLPELNKTR